MSNSLPPHPHPSRRACRSHGADLPGLILTRKGSDYPSSTSSSFTFSHTQQRVTLNVCDWNFAVAPVSPISRIFAGPRRRGALLLFALLRKRAVAPIVTSAQFKDLLYANNLRSLMLAASLNAATWTSNAAPAPVQIGQRARYPVSSRRKLDYI